MSARRVNWPLVIGGVGLCSICFVCAGCPLMLGLVGVLAPDPLPPVRAGAGGSSPAPSIFDLGGTEGEAIAMAEEFVRPHLAYPNNAAFSGGSAERQPNTPQPEFAVTGQVAATNAFGAELIYDYGAWMVYLGNDQWRCDSVVIDGRIMYQREEETPK